ncbi:MAG: hypothetical protein Q9227_003356 [Pyrenula ochraceoflavens]
MATTVTPETAEPWQSDLLIIPPQSHHKQSIILLHGRGSTAQKFAPPLLKHPIPSSTDSPLTLKSALPNAKFIFPTASLRRAVVYNRSLTHQWFDSWTLDRPEHREDLQLRGLKETSLFIHGLLRSEIESVGAENVAIISLSQGWAASLIALLTWQGAPIAGAAGMCGWLPFREALKWAIEDESPHFTEVDDESDFFERPSRNQGSVVSSDCDRANKLAKASAWLRDELQIPAEPKKSMESNVPLQQTPVFMGHGAEDRKVPTELGRQAAALLTELNVDCRWKAYPGLGHWYSGEMLRDIVSFLKSLPGWSSGN